jgi:hypothetical protein
MATSYDRRISFYINGKEITNDIRSIGAEMNKLVREQARMTIGSQEYFNNTLQIMDLSGIIAEHNREVSNVSRAWSMARIGDAFNRYLSMIQAGTVLPTWKERQVGCN